MYFFQRNALFTDFYELTMAQGYWKQKMDYPAVFDMFFRRPPYNGGFSVFAGIEPVLDILPEFRFSQTDIEWLEKQRLFCDGFLRYLETFRFTGDIYAMEEGSVVFPNEPLLRVHAGLIEAQIIEGLILNQINFQSLIATKTARIWLAVRKGNRNSSLMEFGLRRAQGADGAMSASRAAYIGGASSTSNTLAGKLYGIPVQGTMAHSWIMSFPSELEAFRAYADIYPEKSVFLIDTYDTLGSGIANAIEAGRELKEKGFNFGVRLDSGDMQYLSAEVRRLLDSAGFPEATITVSNEMTEEIVETLIQQDAPIDGWGVGTHMVTGGSESSFTGVYKLAARSGGDGGNNEMIPVMKFSDNPEKTTNPGIKNVWRLFDDNGMAKADILALEDEIPAEGTEEYFYHPSVDYRQFSFTPKEAVPLLKKRMEQGQRLDKGEDSFSLLERSRERMKSQLSCFDKSYKRLLNPHIYKVSITEKLKDLKLGFIKRNLRKGPL
jgi:nicotinate phosphoribosyltransferase